MNDSKLIHTHFIHVEAVNNDNVMMMLIELYFIKILCAWKLILKPLDEITMMMMCVSVNFFFGREFDKFYPFLARDFMTWIKELTEISFIRIMFLFIQSVFSSFNT